MVELLFRFNYKIELILTMCVTDLCTVHTCGGNNTDIIWQLLKIQQTHNDNIATNVAKTHLYLSTIKTYIKVICSIKYIRDALIAIVVSEQLLSIFVSTLLFPHTTVPELPIKKPGVSS